MKGTRAEPQGWWKWVVMISSLCSLLLGGSLSYCSGVFHVALLDHFQQDAVLTAWLGSLFASMFALTGPLASLAINLMSCRFCVMIGALLILVGFTLSSFITDMRWLFLTYAILAGIGEGMVYVGSQVVLGFYFSKRTSMATGIGMAGVSLATFVFPPLTQAILDTFGLDGCFLLMGALGFQAAVFGALMRPSDIETEVAKVNSSGKSYMKRILVSCVGNLDNCGDLLQPKFLLFLFSGFCFCVGNYITFLFLPHYFIKRGSSPTEASLLLSVIGIAGSISRVFSGFAAADENIGPLVLYFGTYGIVSLIDFLIVPMTSTLGGKIAYSWMFGLYASPGWVLLSPITLNIVGIQSLASAFGIVMFVCGLGILIGPPIAGVLMELNGDFQTGFYFAGAAFAVTCCCGFLMTLMKTRDKNVAKLGSGDEVKSFMSFEDAGHLHVDHTIVVPGSISDKKAPTQSLHDL